MRTNFLRFVAAGLLIFISTGCAHNYYYTPEISGAGAKSAHGGIIYLIPPQAPALKMKIVSLGVNADKMLHIRIYFVRTAAAPTASEYMVPQEQTVTLGDGTVTVHATRVHASAKDKTTIQLSPSKKQAIEMLFALPSGSTGIKEVPNFNLHWKLHYAGDKIEDQSTRFDRQDSAPRQAAEMYPEDNDYPFDEAPFFAPGSEWMPTPWGWW